MLPPIHTDGHKFVDATGKPFPYAGVSDFPLFKRSQMTDGYNALVTPRLAEWKRLAGAGGYTGPIVLRVFRYAASSNPFGMDPWSYDFDQARVFSNFCGEQGFYVDWTCGDSQIVLPNPDGDHGQQQHVNQFVAALVPCTNAFVQTCNEPFKNGIDVTRVIPPKWGNVIRSSGAYGDNQPDFNAVLDYIDFHPNRDSGEYYWPKWLYDLTASATVIMGEFPVPCIFGEPMGADETDQPGRRSNNPEFFERLGSIVGWCGGVTFHSQNGLTGDGLGPVQSACAARFFKGVQGAI